MTFKIKHFSPISSGEIYKQTNVPVDYDVVKLNTTFDKMKFNSTRNSYDYTSGEVDSNQNPVRKEYEHIYKVFHSYNTTIRNLSDFNPYEWCIIESDKVLSEDILKSMSIEKFTSAQKRIENGDVKVFVAKIK